MKQILCILLLLTAGCASVEQDNPYRGRLSRLTVRAVYPDEFAAFRREGVPVLIRDVDRGNSYEAVTDAEGVAEILLTNGIYLIQTSDRSDDDIFNGTADQVVVADRNVALDLPLLHSKAGRIVIKEIYCGGCMRAPQEGQYQFDKYVILHNNSSEIQYLDSLCFGALDPYNSQATNVWVTTNETTGASVFPDFVPIIQAL